MVVSCTVQLKTLTWEAAFVLMSGGNPTNDFTISLHTLWLLRDAPALLKLISIIVKEKENPSQGLTLSTQEQSDEQVINETSKKEE
jgi:hypothetical protein